jgi:hypothetical protein
MGFLKQILDQPDNERPFLRYPANRAEVPALERKSFQEIAEFV